MRIIQNDPSLVQGKDLKYPIKIWKNLKGESFSLSLFIHLPCAVSPGSAKQIEVQGRGSAVAPARVLVASCRTLKGRVHFFFT